jgi:hypothetical protein
MTSSKEDLLPALRQKNGADCTDAWLSRALRKNVAGVSTAVVGVGESSTTVRASFHEAGNASKKGSVILKVASDKEESRQHGIRTLSYEREVRFYREFAKQLPTIPEVYATALDSDGLFTIVMEDFADATQIDNMHGCEPDVARKVLTALAQTQGPRMGDWMWAGQASPFCASHMS